MHQLIAKYYSLLFIAIILFNVDLAFAFKMADTPYNWAFPRDDGHHLDFQTEWWYFTGHLTDEKNNTYGFEFTVFRVGANQPIGIGAWMSDQIYMAHTALTNDSTQQFKNDSKIQRGVRPLAYSSKNNMDIKIHNWTIKRDVNGLFYLSFYVKDTFVNLEFKSLKPPVLHGDNGLSIKLNNSNSSSYYYSYTRLVGNGNLVENQITKNVSVLAWFDHEFFTSPKLITKLGWHWFSIQLDNGDDYMVFEIIKDNQPTGEFKGTHIKKNGEFSTISASDISVKPIKTWRSPNTSLEYPIEWNIVIGDNSFNLKASVPHQEMRFETSQLPTYWEGRMLVSGDATGQAYVEINLNK